MLVFSIVLCVLIGIVIGVNFAYLWLSKVIVGTREPGNKARLVFDLFVNIIYIAFFFYISYRWFIKGMFRKWWKIKK